MTTPSPASLSIIRDSHGARASSANRGFMTVAIRVERPESRVPANEALRLGRAESGSGSRPDTDHGPVTVTEACGRQQSRSPTVSQDYPTRSVIMMIWVPGRGQDGNSDRGRDAAHWQSDQ